MSSGEDPGIAYSRQNTNIAGGVTTKLKIEMIVDDLRGAEPHDAYMCPIGQALQRMGWEPNVWTEQISIHKAKDYNDSPIPCDHDDKECKDDCNCYCLECTGEGPKTPGYVCRTVPEDVRKFIERFDEGLFVKPRTFEIEFEPEDLELRDDVDFDR